MVTERKAQLDTANAFEEVVRQEAEANELRVALDEATRHLGHMLKKNGEELHAAHWGILILPCLVGLGMH